MKYEGLGKWRIKELLFPKVLHCVKIVQIPSFFGTHFPVFGLNVRKYGQEKTQYFDSFHAVLMWNLIFDAGLMRNNFKWLFVTFFFVVVVFCLYVWNKFHERFLLLRYSDAGTFNLIIVKIGFIKIFYSEVQFVKPSQKKSKRFRKLRLLFRMNSFWRYMNKYHPRRARNHCYLYPLKTTEITAIYTPWKHQKSLLSIPPGNIRNRCYLYPLETSEITAVSVTNSHFIHSCVS